MYSEPAKYGISKDGCGRADIVCLVSDFSKNLILDSRKPTTTTLSAYG